MDIYSKPIGIALIICDDIIEDRLTGKKSLIGIFNRIASEKFPVRHNKMKIFLSICDAKGKYDTELKIVEESSHKTIISTHSPLEVNNPGHTIEMNITFLNVLFPKPGLYSIEFHCNGEIVLQRRFMVEQIKKMG